MRVLALVDAPDHVCCRYRIRAFEPALRRAGWTLDLLPIERGALGRWLQLARLPVFDTAVLQRKLLPDWHLRVLRARCRQLVFDFDDAVPYRDSYDPRGPECPRRADRFAATMRTVDVVLAGNDFLADCALRAGARADRVRVVPTCIDTNRYAPRTAPRPASEGLALVWIGSSSTLRGLEQTRPIWEHLARRVPGVRLDLICDRSADLGPMPVRTVAWGEATEARDVAAGDVGLTWIPDDLWSRGKCGLKLLQYMAAGLPVVANPVGVHSEMVKTGVTGFLPESEDEWVEAVQWLSDDPASRQRMGEAARRSVETGYSVGAWEGAVVAALTGSSAVPSPAFARLNGESGIRAAGRRDEDRRSGTTG